MKQLDSNTARLIVALARQHLDRPCNTGVPEHLQIELAAILTAPEEDIEEPIRRDALALLQECRE